MSDHGVFPTMVEVLIMRKIPFHKKQNLDFGVDVLETFVAHISPVEHSLASTFWRVRNIIS